MPEDVDLTILFLTHDAVRRDLGRLQAAARAGSTTGMADYFGVMSEMLHHHHTMEDRFVWPVLRSKVGADDVRVLDDMESEHERIDPLLARVSAAVGGRAQDVDLASEMDALTDSLTRHLAHEEQDAIPLMRKHFTVADQKKLSTAARKDTGLGGVARFFPWLLDDADPALARQLKSQLPPPLWWLARGPWRRRHERRAAALAG